jgi:hypothetical protein
MMEMTHLSESQLLRVADGASDDPSGMDDASFAAATRHLADCAACRDAVETQRSIHAALAAQPIVPVRDLSAAIRATLEAETPWLERLNWRRLTLRMAPVAAAITLMALLLVQTAQTTQPQVPEAADASTSAPPVTGAAGTTVLRASSHTVSSALFSGDVNEDQLLSLFLSARPDESLATYVQVQ